MSPINNRVGAHVMVILQLINVTTNNNNNEKRVMVIKRHTYSRVKSVGPLASDAASVAAAFGRPRTLGVVGARVEADGGERRQRRHLRRARSRLGRSTCQTRLDALQNHNNRFYVLITHVRGVNDSRWTVANVQKWECVKFAGLL